MRHVMGLRTIKTGIAVALGVVVSNLLGLEYPFFVGMTAIIAMERTLYRSLVMGKVRVLGTFIGAVVGVCFAYVDAGNPMLCGLGIMIVIMICNKLHASTSITIGGIVFMAIMVHIKPDVTPLMYGFHRTLDSLIGAVVAFCVNLAFVPYYNLSKLQHNLTQIYLDVRSSADALINASHKVDVVRLRKSLDDLQLYVQLYAEELLPKAKKEKALHYATVFEQLKELVSQMEIMQKLEAQPVPAGALQGLLEQAQDYHSSFLARQLQQLPALDAA